MALDYTKLAIVAQAEGYKVYMYWTNDTIATVIADGYFDGTYGHKTLNAGDVIIAMCDLDGTPYPCVLIVSVGDDDVTVVAGPPTAAASISIADAGGFTAQTIVEAALQEIYQHIASAQATIPIQLQTLALEDGTPLAQFSDGASATPGLSQESSKETVVRWNNHATPTPIAFSIAMPQDLDDSANIVVHVLALMSGSTDTPELTTQAFFNDGDDDCAGTDDEVDGGTTLTEYTNTIAAANVPAAPCTLTVTMQPKDGEIGTDDLLLYGIWIEYTRKILTS